MFPGLAVGDLARAAIFLSAGAWAIADGPKAALALLLVAPPALAVRFLPAGRWLDAGICIVLLCAQLGASAGLTQTTAWWDGAAHGVTGALLALLFVRVAPRRSPVLAVPAVALVAVAWELLEAASDAAFGTGFAPSLGDTTSDLALGIAGGALGTAAAIAHRRGCAAELPPPAHASPRR